MHVQFKKEMDEKLKEERERNEFSEEVLRNK